MPTCHSTFNINQVPSDFSGHILKHENLSRHTSFRLGGPADCLFIPRRMEDIQLLLRRAQQENIPTSFLGGGTNLLVADTGVRGWVVKTDKLLRGFRQIENRIVAGAGIALNALINKTVSCRLSGLETLYGIPGTLGGAITQNAGAFGSTVSDYLTSIIMVDETGSLREYSKKDLNFSYRSGPFRDKRHMIVEAVFELKPGDSKSLERTIKTVIQERTKIFPLSKPTAGCIFKNTSIGAAGKLIDQAGLKGLEIGGALVSAKHANFIINTGSARAEDVYQLMNLIKERVSDQFGVCLEPEVKLWGF